MVPPDLRPGAQPDRCASRGIPPRFPFIDVAIMTPLSSNRARLRACALVPHVCLPAPAACITGGALFSFSRVLVHRCAARCAIPPAPQRGGRWGCRPPPRPCSVLSAVAEAALQEPIPPGLFSCSKMVGIVYTIDCTSQWLHSPSRMPHRRRQLPTWAGLNGSWCRMSMPHGAASVRPSLFLPTPACPVGGGQLRSSSRRSGGGTARCRWPGQRAAGARERQRA